MAVFLGLFVSSERQLFGADFFGPVFRQLLQRGGALLKTGLCLGILLGEKRP